MKLTKEETGIELNTYFNESGELVVESISSDKTSINSKKKRIIAFDYPTDHAGRFKISQSDAGLNKPYAIMYVDNNKVHSISIDNINLRGKEYREYEKFVLRNNELAQYANKHPHLARYTDKALINDEKLYKNKIKYNRDSKGNLSVYNKDGSLFYRENIYGERF